MSEIAEAKPTLVSRGRGAAASLQTYFPGVLVSLIIAVAATFLSEHYGGPVMLFALLLGMTVSKPIFSAIERLRAER